jgi:hypothetical protein
MKDKILALLSETFTGVRKDVLIRLAGVIALQAKTDDEAKGIIEKLTLTEVQAFERDYRSDVDKEVATAVKNHEAKLKKASVNSGNDPDEDTGKKEGAGKKTVIPEGGDDANNVTALLAELKDELNKLRSENSAKSRLQSLNDKLSTCKDDNFKTQTLKDFSRMQFNSEEEFTEYLTEKETAITTANQSVADKELGGQGKPLFGAKDKAGTSTSVVDYLAIQKTENNPFAGKPV